MSCNPTTPGTGLDLCEDCGLVDCVCDSEDDWDDDDDYDGDGPCECDECADDDDDTPEAAAAEYVRNHNGDLFRQPSDLGTSEGKAAPDFARCPERDATTMQALARSIRADAATRPPDVAREWAQAVECEVDYTYPRAPVPPIDGLAEMIREDGGLDETPALALLDEIQRLRAARSDYDRGIADAVAVIEPMLTAATELLMAANHWTDSTDAIAGLDDTVDAFARARDAVAALKRGDA